MWARPILVSAYVFLLLLIHISPIEAKTVIRLGVLDYGTASWEAAVVGKHHLDADHDFVLETTRFATGDAAKVALQAGEVDVVVSDWLWVARRRADGAGLSFLPFSRNTGTVLVRPSSSARDIAIVSNLRIGVAGGPLDKNWLLFRAFTRQQLGKDIADTATLVYGSPPLLEAELRRGRIDVLLTYWQSAARLLGKGEAQALMNVSDMASALGYDADLPFLGYVFREDWARTHAKPLRDFWLACQQARDLLTTSDAAWAEIEPMVGSEDSSVIALLRTGYRNGQVRSWGTKEHEGAKRFFMLLGELGGTELVGTAKSLPQGTFWPLDLP